MSEYLHAEVEGYPSFEVDVSTLGKRVRAQREKRGLSMADLGRAVGSSHSFVSQLENGLHEPKVGKVLEIARALGVRVEYLIEGDKEDGESRSVPADLSTRAQLRARLESDTLLFEIIQSIETLENYIEPLATLIKWWSDLPPNEAILIGELIALSHYRMKRKSNSGKPTFLVAKEDEEEYSPTVREALKHLGISLPLQLPEE